MLKYILIACGLLVSTNILAMGDSGRHAMILHPSENKILGSYIFGAKNETETAKPYRTEISLPKEMTDFQVQSGITPDEVKLGDGGTLVIEKILKPGSNFISLGFVVPSFLGSAKLTFEMAMDVGEFAVLIPVNSIKMTSDTFKHDPNPSKMFRGKYETYLSEGPMLKGRAVEITLSGIPEGTARLWYSAIAFAFALILIAAIMTVVTLPGRTK